MVQLPFKSEKAIDFGNSLNVALNRFYSTERRIASSQYLTDKYISFMEEYLNLGHMEEIPDNELNTNYSKSFYLPHHAVLKDDSSTTKVRVVFDGSARSSHNHPSLNETLLIGKSYQRDLFSICIRFRRHRYTISGDIEKMFRQIRVSKEHADFQRILWRKSSSLPLKHYRLLTVTYGTACAPFLAVRTLYQLAIDSAETHPRASEVLLNDFYVDDVMTGADTIEEVTSLRLELISLLNSAGLNLRKWTTNCWPLLLSLPEEQREMSPKEFEEYSTVKLLGLQWSPANDSFSYKVNLNDKASSTKRQILSESSRIFDPIGFLTPVVIGIKILFQELWRKKYKWDDVISSEHAKTWHCIRDELPAIEKLSIPRIMWSSKNNVEFHAFCDASLDAFAAVIYCRSVDLAGNITSNIVAAKSRVAPIKVVSLPRLELCGAVLLTRLVTKLKTSLQDKEIKVVAWTDSAIVLHWLSALPKRWSVFIGNRTSEILSTIPRESWHHVRSEQNPADCASRGVPPSHLLQNDSWWTGPSWIIKERDQWPKSEYSVDNIQPEDFEQRKKHPTFAFVAKLDSTNIFCQVIDSSSRFLKSVRVIGFIFRYISNIRELVAIRKELKRLESNEISDSVKKAELKKRLSNARDKSVPKTQSLALSSLEISTAKTELIRFHQILSFACEIDDIKCGKNLEKGNKLASLAPFVDDQGLLRVGGRIQEAYVAYSAKHPIILDKNTRIAKLIVEHFHNSNCHAGVSLLFALLRQEYYIIGCRNLLRKIVHKCVPCFRQQKTTSTQQMGNLPADRVQFSRPFSKVGVDYAGPLTLRIARGRNPKFTKAYIALFICFSTKAIHIELVSDLSSNAFIAALDRFASRRGKPSEIWSDNGTNFHGANRCLNEMFQLLLSQQHNDIIIDHLSKDKISWNFIPPSSPHFGGLWEAGVKSVKFHLNRVIKDHRLTYEEMYTLLTQIEALLNSRPMWPTSDMDPIALSPAHFLIGETMNSIPHPFVSDQNIFTNWSLLQSLKQGFWKQWHSEYLTSLQQRPKWQGVKPDLKPGDVVMLKDSNLPPAKWVLGRVKEVHPGKDKRVRVATITTQTGDYVRPIVKISPLPFC
ncbi:uncharacterized protein LOC129914935 [Episyrphus balteatus]|uniref:uncharacterized protein LOC129914935 n=1 Tax=Episyrphus balteatus TaxID=286459 RepID=UPI002485D59D|nr:uncharacterized protein LOC129914935 [Episyrphus balteatus]